MGRSICKIQKDISLKTHDNTEMLQKFLAPLLLQSFALADFPPLIIKGEKCPPNPINSQNLTLESLPNYNGVWYANAHTLNPFQDSKDYCPTANYTTDTKPNKFGAPAVFVDNGYTDPETIERRDLIGKAYFIKNGNLFVLFSKYLSKFITELPEEGNYHILETDANHQEYTYVYSCDDNFNAQGECESRPEFWVMTRSTNSYDFMGQSIFDRVDHVMDLYRQMGASEYAVETAYSYFSYNQMVECDAPEGPKWDDGEGFWKEKVKEWINNH